jgi:hypothetical protein
MEAFQFATLRGRSAQPTFPGLFDWVVTQHGVTRRATPPTSVYFELGHASSRDLTRLMADESRPFNASVLVVAGNDRSLRQARRWGLDVRLAVRAFRRVYWETMNVANEAIRPFPCMFSALYARDVGEAMMRRAAQRANVSDKPSLLLAVWGQYEPQLDSSPNCRDRGAARQWVTRHQHEPWVSSTKLAPVAYWDALPRYQFVLSPSGLGVQSSKTFEALTALAIPIVHSSNVAYRRLRAEGWPLAMVDDWEEITPERMRAWRAAMAPDLARARECMHAPTLLRHLREDLTMRDCIERLRASPGPPARVV